MNFELHHGDALDVLATLPEVSVDSVVTDPPYAEIDRPYGRLSEREWSRLMRAVVRECRRILKPRGSAVFILQANQSRVGSTRPWLWEFMAWSARWWNQVQDAWWWNPAAIPTVHCQQIHGLMRPSVKACVWLGAPDCFRNQSAVLLEASIAQTVEPCDDNRLIRSPGGATFRRGRVARRVRERGGVTPFNCLAIPNTASVDHPGHGAMTPDALTAWWCRYLTPPGGTVLDPFAGSGTTLIAALREGFHAIGIEREAEYERIARRRIEEDAPLFNRPEAWGW